MVHAFDLKGNQSVSSMERGGLQGLPLPGVTRRAGQRMLGVFRTIMYLTIHRKPWNGIEIDRMAGPRVTRHCYQQGKQGQNGTSHLIQTTYSMLCAIFSHQWLFCENLNFKALHSCDDQILKYTPIDLCFKGLFLNLRGLKTFAGDNYIHVYSEYNLI